MDADTSTPAPRAPPVTGTESVQRASVAAGTALLAMALLAGFGNVYVLERLVVPGDPTGTATNVLASTGLFRAAIVSLLAVAVLDVVVATALYTVFEPANRRISRLSAGLRLVYAGVFAVAIANLLTALDTLTGPTALDVYATQRRHAHALHQIETFTHLWTVGLALFGVHLLLLGYLAYSASYTPNYLAAFVALAGVGYLADSLGTILVAGYPFEVASATFVGEVVLIAWLLVRGRDVELDGGGRPSEDEGRPPRP